MIVIIMVLFYICFIDASIYKFYYFTPNLSVVEYSILTVITLLVAAGGYIINDLFDVEIDEMNKPNKVIINKQINEISAYNLYKALSILAVLLVIVLLILTKNIKLATIPILIMAALNFYAQYFKKMGFLGNIVIAISAAMVILLPALYEADVTFYSDNQNDITAGIFLAGLFYALFAFITTIIREIVKDIEDEKGDAYFEAKTLPVKFGIVKTKIIINIFILILLLLLLSFALFFPAIHVDGIQFYIIIFLIVPLLLINILLWLFKTIKQYNILSNLIKLYMLGGVLTMLYFIGGTGPVLFIQYINFMKRIL